MATITTLPKLNIAGGAFLIEERKPEEVFTPEDFSEQHLLIAQTAGKASGANPRRIDVHHHLQLPGVGNASALNFWTPARALEEMDKHGIETTILSRPGGEADAGGEKARAFARRVNEYAAKVVSDNPRRFGFFAVIPYPALAAFLGGIR